jgi:hypothetical protein
VIQDSGTEPHEVGGAACTSSCGPPFLVVGRYDSDTGGRERRMAVGVAFFEPPLP